MRFDLWLESQKQSNDLGSLAPFAHKCATGVVASTRAFVARTGRSPEREDYRRMVVDLLDGEGEFTRAWTAWRVSLSETDDNPVLWPFEFPPTIAVDFDGVIYSFRTGFTGPVSLPDAPVPGAIEWLTKIVEDGVRVIIHTSRLTVSTEGEERFDEGLSPELRRAAIERWLRKWGLPDEVLGKLEFWTRGGKPHAHVYLDDRGWRFAGMFPTADAIRGFRPWVTP